MEHTDMMNKAVLVIDDDSYIRELFIDLFSDFSIKLDTAETGETGLQMISDKEYNIVFVDVNLPGMNGIDILKAAQKIQPESNYIVISGYLTEELTEAALKSGADGYITKPLTVRDILSTAMRYTSLDGT